MSILLEGLQLDQSTPKMTELDFFSSLRYETPLDVMKEIVDQEQLLAALKYGDSWMLRYYYNSHFLHPYKKKGVLRPGVNLENAQEMGDAHTPHRYLYDPSTYHRHSPLFLSISPAQLDQVRVIIATELGHYNDAEFTPVTNFMRVKDSGDYPEIKRQREAMFTELKPFWLRFKAFGFNNYDLKS